MGALTCYGAILSLNPPVGEVETWLNQEVTSDRVPWIFSYCLSLVKTPGIVDCYCGGCGLYGVAMVTGTAQSLQMEAIQVLTAIVKFNFHSIRYKVYYCNCDRCIDTCVHV